MSAKIVRIVGIIAILWNALGVIAYLQYVGVIAGDPPSPGPVMPPLVTGAFAIGGFGALIGSLGLALLKRWARPFLWVAMAGLIIDWGWVFANRTGELALGLTVLVVTLTLTIIAQRTPHLR